MLPRRPVRHRVPSVAPIFQCTSSADGWRDVYDGTTDRWTPRLHRACSSVDVTGHLVAAASRRDPPAANSSAGVAPWVREGVDRRLAVLYGGCGRRRAGARHGAPHVVPSL